MYGLIFAYVSGMSNVSIKPLLLASLLVALPLFASGQQTQSDVFVPIAKYLEHGNAKNLSAWFSENIELVMFGQRSNCSRSQARQIMKRFFEDYTPHSFDIVHKSGVYPMTYAIGKLEGGGNKFRITIFVKTTERGNYIQQLSIDKE